MSEIKLEIYNKAKLLTEQEVKPGQIVRAPQISEVGLELKCTHYDGRSLKLCKYEHIFPHENIFGYLPNHKPDMASHRDYRLPDDGH